MPQVVGRHTRHARYGDGFDEPPVGARSFEVSAILAGEQQIVAVSPVALAGQIGQQELGQRHAALLVGLRGSHANLLAHLDGVLGDGGPSAQHVQVADPQTDGLAPAQAGVGHQQHQTLVGARGCGQFGHLLVGQVDRSLAVLAGQLDIGGRVAGQQIVANGVGQDRRQHVVGAA